MPDTEQTGVTGQQMCEYIAAYLKDRHGEDIEPLAIWNADPRGELFHVAALYQEAKAWRAEQRR